MRTTATVPPATREFTTPQMRQYVSVIPPSMGWKWAGVGALVTIGTLLVIEHGRRQAPKTSRKSR